MSTKLTLTINKQVIEKAKKYAKAQDRSLSNLIEDYLKSLVDPKVKNEDFEYSPIVTSLWGSVKLEDTDLDYDQLLEEELIKKYIS